MRLYKHFQQLSTLYVLQFRKVGLSLSVEFRDVKDICRGILQGSVFVYLEGQKKCGKLSTDMKSKPLEYALGTPTNRHINIILCTET
jgi:hypothetical protein